MLLKNATVISMTGPDSAPGARADVLIADGRITQVAAQSAVPAGGGAGDLRGKFLIPGLIDARCHITTSGDHIEVEVTHDPRARILRAAHNAGMTLLAGITTIRDTCGLDDSDIVLRDAIRSG